MKKRSFVLKNRIDHLYIGILLVDLLIAAALLCSRLSGKINFFKVLQQPHFLLFGIRPGSVLALIAFGVIFWRIWMARRYKACAPVAEEELPTITIVIPAYNEGSQILPTVRSVMNSNYPAEKMQVISVDDGSTDDTWQWMLKARQEYPARLKLVRQPKNSGKREALMAGFQHASSEVWVTIDSDSEVLPDTLVHLVSPFAVNPKVGAVAGNVRVLNRDEGAIPKMMEVFFTAGFDFIRAGQSVYGGVFCTPGALSAYRVSVIREHLNGWVKQAFLGTPATIGEDRALTNLVLKTGYRVVYQREAVVLTKVPIAFQGLRKMMLRWARSNVRESLVMVSFMFKRFRKDDSGGGWVRFISGLQIFQLLVGETAKVGLVAQLIMKPFATLLALAIGALIGAIIPGLVYHIRYRSWFGWRWAVPYSFFSVFALSWISFWGLISAARSGWLTRSLPSTAAPLAQFEGDSKRGRAIWKKKDFAIAK
ncbi:MAG: glycosyltransferase [Syntrophobacteraceae bacterium]|nr:glycosyltransferase [Syntrophobacteraceae bacterium]